MTAMLEERPSGDERPANERLVRQGGMMRCCTGTLAESKDMTAVGDTMDCRYCSGKMKVAEDGIWQAGFIR